ncbi:MAG: class I SAM-dependent methyltransferase [Pirellulales bacterium]|nr:class I SAM-dependent methyltransferase [Pirellulales bacterium]
MKSGAFYNLIQEGFSRGYQLLTGGDPYPLRDLLLRRYAQRPPGKILDVGCGSGCFAFSGHDYTGVDPNPKYVAYCQAERPGTFAQMPGDRLEFADATFDTVLCFSVGHHVDDATLDRILTEIGRVLRPSGRLYFADPIRPINPWRPVAWSLEWLDEGNHFRDEQQYREALERHYHIAAREELVDQFFRTVFYDCTPRPRPT